jgi:hypothetical protein
LLVGKVDYKGGGSPFVVLVKNFAEKPFREKSEDIYHCK